MGATQIPDAELKTMVMRRLMGKKKMLMDLRGKNGRS